MSGTDRPGYMVDLTQMDPRWPTHACPKEFWEELGRTVAAFGFLEDCLKRANLAITATRKYNSVEEAKNAFSHWEKDLERSLDETIGLLTNRFICALKEDDRFRTDYVIEIDAKLKKVAGWRNALCHGAWTDYDEKSGLATLRFWPRKRWHEQSERHVSCEELCSIRRAAVEITAAVINSVTRNKIPFPGSTGPGEPAFPLGSE